MKRTVRSLLLARVEVTALLAFTLAPVAQSMPATLAVSVNSCAGTGDGILNASGTVTSSDGYWKAVTVRVVATIENTATGALRDIQTEVGILDIYQDQPKAFQGGFWQVVRLAESERIKSCNWSFGGGTHVVRKKVYITTSDTPVSKDEECFRDFLKARQLTGLEGRKRITELLQYGCLVIIAPSLEAISPKQFVEQWTGQKLAAVSAIFREEGKAAFSGITLAGYLMADNAPFDERVGPDPKP